MMKMTPDLIRKMKQQILQLKLRDFLKGKYGEQGHEPGDEGADNIEDLMETLGDEESEPAMGGKKITVTAVSTKPKKPGLEMDEEMMAEDAMPIKKKMMMRGM